MNSNSSGRMKYERRWIGYLLIFPMLIITLWVLIKKGIYGLFRKVPRTNSIFFDGNSDCRYVKDYEASGKALEKIYSYNNPRGEIRANAWLWASPMAQGVRNRLSLVTSLIENHVGCYSPDKKITIHSVAAGAGEAIVRILKNHKNTSALLIDIDEEVLKESRQKAKQANISEDRVWELHANALRRETSQLWDQYPKADVIELVGILDYLPDKYAVHLLRTAKEKLCLGGILITGNMAWNGILRPEVWALHTIANWRPMQYRTAYHLKRVLQASGFNSPEIHVEPHRLFLVACATKET